MYGFSREAVRIKVKKCEGRCQPELRKFSVDPQITSLEILQSILIKAFELKSEFTICYKTLDEYGTEIHLPILSDWDLDTAFLKAHNIAVVQRSEPCVNLRIDMKTFTECDDEEEGIPAQESLKGSDEQLRGPQGDSKSGIHGLIMNQVERTFNMVTRALNFHEDPTVAPRPPLNDAEFRSYLDPVGRIINDVKLREAIYCGGIEPSLRKVVWKHILNVYPEGMTGRERMDYMKQKATEYYTLRNNWKECIQKGQVNSDVAYVTTMVRKDVLRTDRHHEFYAGSDDNQNIASLFNILTTYALNHPKVSYCQGMSDLASPLLVTMVDEAQAYICLCALMCRLYTNFMLDGEAMTVKFAHLTEALQVYDNEFYTYLKMHQADDLLFCYRWLLLEMKREFAFEDALRMLEVLWASLPPKPPDNELKLKEQEFDPNITIQTFQPDPVSPMNKTPRETAYTKVCEIRRKSSTFSLLNATNSNRPSFKKMNHSLDENVIRKSALKHVKEFQSLDDTALRLQRQYSPSLSYTIDENCEKKTNILTNGQDEITLGGQLRQLRDKISTHNNKFFTSLEKLDGHINTTTDDSQVKIIKNLNEFLTLANKSKTIKSEHARSRNESDISDSTLDDSEVFTDSKSEKKLMENSSPDDSQDYYPMTSSITRKLRLELEHLDRQVFGPAYSKFDSVCDSPSSERKPIINIEENSELNENIEQPRKVDGVFLWENPLLSKSPSGQRTPDEQVDLELDGDTSEATNTFCDEIRAEKPKDSSCEINDGTDSSSIEPNVTDALLPNNSKNEKTKQYKFFSNMSHELENARKSCEILLNAKQTNKLHSVTDTITNIQKKYEQLKINPADRSFISPQPPMQLAGETLPSTKWTVNNLPIPSEFGCGNPFLMFLCLTILLQHRDYIMRNKMDYNELAMHFDKMVRKHNVNRVLNQARQMYIMYQKQHPTINHIVM